jgi:hypothetical protein
MAEQTTVDAYTKDIRSSREVEIYVTHTVLKYNLFYIKHTFIHSVTYECTFIIIYLNMDEKRELEWTIFWNWGIISQNKYIYSFVEINKCSRYTSLSLHSDLCKEQDRWLIRHEIHS